MRLNPLAARRYAEALYQVSESKEKVLEELRSFLSVLESSRDIEAFFISPIVPISEQKSALESLKDKFPQTFRFFTTLEDAKRFDIFKEIVGAFQRLKEEE